MCLSLFSPGRDNITMHYTKSQQCVPGRDRFSQNARAFHLSPRTFYSSVAAPLGSSAASSAQCVVRSGVVMHSVGVPDEVRPETRAECPRFARLSSFAALAVLRSAQLVAAPRRASHSCLSRTGTAPREGIIPLRAGVVALFFGRDTRTHGRTGGVLRDHPLRMCAWFERPDCSRQRPAD